VAESFNADFYVTCATVIPVLFLAVALQGRLYNSLLKSALNARRQVIEDDEPALGSLIKAGCLPSVAYAIWLAGAGGEVCALLALYWRNDSPSLRLIVLLATLILVVAAAASPLLTYAKVRLAPLLDWPVPELEEDTEAD
jgi:hypothetical protein